MTNSSSFLETNLSSFNMRIVKAMHLDRLVSSSGYYREGFLTLQQAIDMAIIESKGVNTRNISTLLRRYPYPPYYDDRYVSILQFNFPDVIMFGVILIALNIARSVTHEKEKRLKVTELLLFFMKLMKFLIHCH